MRIQNKSTTFAVRFYWVVEAPPLQVLHFHIALAPTG